MRLADLETLIPGGLEDVQEVHCFPLYYQVVRVPRDEDGHVIPHGNNVTTYRYDLDDGPET